jgi:hypothetical protein
MMDVRGTKKPGLTAGWILVTGLMLLCITGTGLTWWNYSRHVFSTADGIVLQAQGEGEETLISIHLPSGEAGSIRIGHGAIVTVADDAHPHKGRVKSVIAGKPGTEATIILRLIHDQGEEKMLPTGTKCSVTIDTTVPPLDELKESGDSSQAPPQ